MDYRQGRTGRVFSIRFDEGEDFLEGLLAIVRKERIRQAWFQVIGGLRRAEFVTGPKKPVMPPDPVWDSVEEDGARETLGAGSIFWEDDAPKIHLHAALGHHGQTTTGCVRKGTQVYLLLEVFLIEIEGFEADRPWYEKGGFNRLSFRD
jgi:predicted DNA-binding protein with PD1-like motif